MFSPDNDFSKFKNINFCIVYHIIVIDIGFYYILVIAYAFKDEVMDEIGRTASTHKPRG